MIKPLSINGRVIAVDMIGYGKSDKPNIEYQLTDLQEYLTEFIYKLDLTNIRLIVHDMGGPIALSVAAKNQERIAGIVAFETIFGPIESYNSLNDFQKSLDDRKSITGPGGQGYGLIVRKNIFINGVINKLMAEYSSEIREAYAMPFTDPLNRIAIYRPFQDIPVEGIPEKTKQILEITLHYLRTSSVPKLYIYPDPGFTTIMPEGSPIMAQTFNNVELHPFGPGGHFLPEENSQKLTEIINNWLMKIKNDE